MDITKIKKPKESEDSYLDCPEKIDPDCNDSWEHVFRTSPSGSHFYGSESEEGSGSPPIFHKNIKPESVPNCLTLSPEEKSISSVTEDNNPSNEGPPTNFISDIFCCCFKQK